MKKLLVPRKLAITKTETSLACAEMRLHLAVKEVIEARTERDRCRHLWRHEQIKRKKTK